MPDNYEIDNTDLKILNLLSKDAKMPYTEIAKKVFVSGGTVHVRMKKLEQMGVVKGYTVMFNHAKLGFDLTAFIGIYLEKSSLYDKVLSQLKEIPEIVTIHYTTGNYSMFCKMYLRDTKHLMGVLHDKLQKIEGIERTETIITLEESLNRNLQLDWE